MVKFEVGTTYYTRSICDSDCIYRMTVVRRTEKTISVTLGTDVNVKLLRVSPDYRGNEMVKPHGSYSMAAIIDATDTKVLRPSWEKVSA